ncbi:MAG: heparinase II/III family protein [Phycisphaerae bacterium]|nr:heparinase II/III family protein [Phycisphaerae bacterium]
MRRLIFTSLLVLVGSFNLTWCGAAEISQSQVQKVLSKPVAAHPRLFVNDDQLRDIKDRISASDDLKVLHEEIVRQADELIDKEPVERTKIGRRLLSVSRKALQRLFNLSWAYRSTGDKKYLKRAEAEMLAIANFTDWNPSHFLDVAEMTTAMAVGYDWLYNGLPEESRNVIKSAILDKGIVVSLYENKRPGWWINTNNNWNQVCHGGMACGALAVMEDEPELAETIIHRSVNKVQLAMGEYEPDGAYPEGPGYWVYGTTYNVILIEALDSALGTDFGLSGNKAFAKGAEYYLHATGPTGLFFNYADCGSKGGFTSTVLWFAKRYNDPSLLWNQKMIWDRTAKEKPSSLARSRTSVMSLLWGIPEATLPGQLSWMGRGHNPVAMFRSSWDKNASYVGIKGGTASSNHAHMDAGSFVIDAEGERWAMDMGAESYNRVESMGVSLWSKNQDADRWKLFRYGNFGHNTLAFNGQLLRAAGFAPIIRYSDKSKFPHAAVDLTDVYSGQLKKAVRGAALLPSGQVLIQDELEAGDQAATVRWNMVTPAKVDIKSDTAAVLSQNNKTMQFEVFTDSNVKAATYSTEPRSKYDAENPGTCMIGFDVKLKANEKVTVKVVMTPGAKAKPIIGDIKNVEKWSAAILNH